MVFMFNIIQCLHKCVTDNAGRHRSVCSWFGYFCTNPMQISHKTDMKNQKFIFILKQLVQAFLSNRKPVCIGSIFSRRIIFLSTIYVVKLCIL